MDQEIVRTVTNKELDKAWSELIVLAVGNDQERNLRDRIADALNARARDDLELMTMQIVSLEQLIIAGLEVSGGHKFLRAIYDIIENAGKRATVTLIDTELKEFLSDNSD